ENVSTEDREIPDHAHANLFRLMFRAEKDGAPFHVVFNRALRIGPVQGPAVFKMKPGKRFSETFTLTFRQKPGELWLGLPDIDVGKSLTLQVGLCSRGVPAGEEQWKADDTATSGAIRVRRQADGEAKATEPPE